MAQTTETQPRFTEAIDRSPGVVWRLHVLGSRDPLHRGAVYELPTGTTVVGRQPEGEQALACDDPIMSRSHTALLHRGGAAPIQIRDLGSRNGTWLAGRRIASTEAGGGAVLRMGSMVAVLECDTGRAESHKESTDNLPGRSEVARVSRAAIALAARDRLPALITGETGTGKELAAAELHLRGRSSGPLVRVNVTALPATLFESELFGHTAGAFSGALLEHAGRIREAHRGTLVLDEIGELPWELQPKLLRAVEAGRIRPVGGPKDVPVDVRFVASTNEDLEDMVRAGSFRHDLLARFSSHVIELSPLRNRPQDLLLLADAVQPPPGGRRSSWADHLDADAIEALALYDWPANLRELRAALVRVTATADGGKARAADLPPGILDRVRDRAAEPKRDTEQTWPGAGVRRPDADALRLLLQRHGGNVLAVARDLATHRRQIYRWLDKAGISREELERYRGP